MPTLIMTKGLPASGKTTWAKQQTAKRVNKDDLRAMIDNGKWSKENEKLIILARDRLIALFVESGYDVIVDDTNLHPKHEQNLRLLADREGAEFDIKDFTDVPLETCLERDRKRPNYVGEKVIKDMYNQFLKPKQDVAQYERSPFLRDAILCDIDGTLAHMNGRSPYDWSRVTEDLVDDIVANTLSLEASTGTPIVLMSGRDGICRQDTIKWLVKHDIPYDELWMRAPGDTRKDAIIKRELFDQYVRGRYNVKYVLDDRNQVVEMWRSMGLKVLQVEEGDF